MKIKTLLFLALASLCRLEARTQVAGVSDIGVGYFNGHQFATFGTITGTPPTLTGSLGSNSFVINFSNNARNVFQLISGYGPSLPANSGTFSTAFMEMNYTTVPATSTITFTNPLQPLDALHAVDIENSESVTFEFLDASNTPVVLANNVRVVSLSTISPTASLNYPSSTMVGINTDPGRITTGNSDQGFSFVMLTNVVKTIRIIQTNSSSGATSFDFTLSKGSPDRGDAPASYGNALHLSLPALKLGTNGGDGDGSVFSGTTASGDNTVSGSTIINDEDGVATVPAVSNNGGIGQVIPTYSISARVTNSSGASANVMAWADWSGDGVFQSSEAATTTAVPTGSNNVARTFTWTNVTLGGSAGRTGTYLRVRTTSGALTTADAAGFAPDGEVEDYFIAYAVTLPVTINSFNVTAIENRAARLDWVSESESGNLGFGIEHSSNGQDWKEISFRNSQAPGGNSATTLRYQFLHESPNAGVNYYRLRQTDADGRGSYSQVRTINITGPASAITVTPNPAGNLLTVNGVKQGDMVSLHNPGGQLMANKTAGAGPVTFNLGGYAKGVYTVNVRSALTGVQTFRVLKNQ